MSTDPLLLERRDAVAIVTINDQPYNRMTLDFVDQLESTVADIAADASIRAVLLTSAGLDNFSVGMNLKQGSNPVRLLPGWWVGNTPGLSFSSCGQRGCPDRPARAGPGNRPCLGR